MSQGMRFTVLTWQSSWFYCVGSIETWQSGSGWQCGGWEGVRFLMRRKGIEGVGVAVWFVSLLGCYFIADCSQISWHQKCSVSSKGKYLCSVTSRQHHESWVQFCTQVFFHCQSFLLHFSFLSCIFSDWLQPGLQRINEGPESLLT